jgi:hypothetical protein
MNGQSLELQQAYRHQEQLNRPDKINDGVIPFVFRAMLPRRRNPATDLILEGKRGRLASLLDGKHQSRKNARTMILPMWVSSTPTLTETASDNSFFPRERRMS